jgi:hypothetical protein
MKRFAIGLTLTLVAALAGAAPADADKDGRIVWLLPTFYAGVQIVTNYPSAADPYMRARFKRVAGEGQRQVRMGERVKKPGTHQWGPYHYTKPVKLAVGEKVVFTSEHALPCEPEIEPIGIVADMRVKMPGKPWSRWETWIAGDQRLLDCEEVLPD